MMCWIPPISTATPSDVSVCRIRLLSAPALPSTDQATRYRVIRCCDWWQGCRSMKSACIYLLSSQVCTWKSSLYALGAVLCQISCHNAHYEHMDGERDLGGRSAIWHWAAPAKELYGALRPNTVWPLCRQDLLLCPCFHVACCGRIIDIILHRTRCIQGWKSWLSGRWGGVPCYVLEDANEESVQKMLGVVHLPWRILYLQV